MSGEVEEWSNFFDQMFHEAKKQIQKRYRLEEDGSGPPEIVAVREIAANLHCPVRIVDVKIDTNKHKHIQDRICQMIRYDFSQLGLASSMVEYLGVVDADDSERFRELFVNSFGLQDGYFEDFCKDFRTIGFFDDQTNLYVQFSPYDIRKYFNKFVFDFLSHVFDSAVVQRIRETSRKGVDWLSKFKLNPDPIVPYAELVKMDKIVGFFPRFSEGTGIEKLQEDTCNIQLMPGVPEEVVRIFRNAKDLYIYGFFRYSFFTIAQHYAFLALESAIKNRYYQSFPKENTLTNERGESVKIGDIDHQRIIDFCRRNRWNVYKLRINGEKFAFKTSDLLDWLEHKGIVTRWERKLCNRGMDIRNYMSHLTSPSVIMPSHSAQSLAFVADLINRLYSH